MLFFLNFQTNIPKDFLYSKYGVTYYRQCIHKYIAQSTNKPKLRQSFDKPKCLQIRSSSAEIIAGQYGCNVTQIYAFWKMNPSRTCNMLPSQSTLWTAVFTLHIKLSVSIVVLPTSYDIYFVITQSYKFMVFILQNHFSPARYRE